MRARLEVLAVAAPRWLADHLDDSWGKRYAARAGTWRMPASTTKKDALALVYGRDGHTLLKAVYAAGRDPDLSFLARLHQAGVLRVVLVQNYLIVTGERGREAIKRREAEVDGLPPGRSRITSPYDTGARWASSATPSGTATRCTSPRLAAPAPQTATPAAKVTETTVTPHRSPI